MNNNIENNFFFFESIQKLRFQKTILKVYETWNSKKQVLVHLKKKCKCEIKFIYRDHYYQGSVRSLSPGGPYSVVINHLLYQFWWNFGEKLSEKFLHSIRNCIAHSYGGPQANTTNTLLVHIGYKKDTIHYERRNNVSKQTSYDDYVKCVPDGSKSMAGLL